MHKSYPAAAFALLGALAIMLASASTGCSAGGSNKSEDSSGGAGGVGAGGGNGGDVSGGGDMSGSAGLGAGFADVYVNTDSAPPPPWQPPPVDDSGTAAETGRVDPNVSFGDRTRYCLDYDWKFIKQDVANAQAPAFDDAAWKSVSLPHTFNDVDHWDDWITNGGDNGHYCGKTWYRKHFKIPAKHAGMKVLLEFEGLRQVGTFYVNGVKVGLHENGVGPIGLDITSAATIGDDNVLAVMVDSTQHIKEQATGVDFEWDTPPFNPEYGGIVKNAYLHVMNPVHQTLPLYSNLKTSGVYVYQTNVDIPGAQADVTVQAEVANETASAQDVEYSISIYDVAGNAVVTATAAVAESVAAGATKSLTLTGHVTGVHFWSADNPYLYYVYSQLKIGGTLVDAVQTPIGIRLISFVPGQGLIVNGTPTYLRGYAPRATMEWPTVGQAPNWLEEYDFILMKQSYANLLRPMHTAPRKADVDAADKLGYYVTVPAGDGEQDVTGRMWDQRVELMRDVMIYYRNHPSVFFYESGNAGIALDHMTSMLAVRDQWDPKGNRYIGNRTPPPDTKTLLSDPKNGTYVGSMDVPATSATVPLWDAEYCRSECPRRVWDAYSPPSSWTTGTYLGYASFAKSDIIDKYPTDSFKYNSSEDLARRNVRDHYRRWSLRGGQGKADVMVGGAKILFADSVSHGRLANVEVARVSGSVDGARLPKETYYALQAAWNPWPAVHVIGHWTYPAGTVKDVFVIANCDQVTLATYDTGGKLIKDYGNGTVANKFEFGFAQVAWQPGKVRASCLNAGKEAASHEIATAGPPAKLKLTPMTGPSGFLADGSDIAMFDVEVLDANGLRCPNEESTVTFTPAGASATFLGGYNSGIENSLFKNDLKVEAGVNRVFARATRVAGDFTLTVAQAGLASATATVTAKAVTLTDGLTDDPRMPQSYPPPPVR